MNSIPIHLRVIVLICFAFTLVSRSISDEDTKRQLGKLEWAPIKCEVRIFPEIAINDRIFEDVAVLYYVAKSSLKPIDMKLMVELREVQKENKLEMAALPMATELGHLVLHDADRGEFFAVSILEHNTIIFRKCTPKHTKPPTFFPILGEGRAESAFHSKAIAEKLLKLPSVRVPLSAMPWLHKK